MTLRELIEELNRFAAELGDGDAAVRLVVKHDQEGFQYELLEAELYREVLQRNENRLRHGSLDARLYQSDDGMVLLFAGQQPAVMDWPGGPPAPPLK